MRRHVSPPLVVPPLLLIVPALLAVTLLAGCAAESAPEAPPAAVRLQISGMTCGGCEQAIRTAVGKLPGVESVEASHADGEARVTLSGGEARADELKTTVEALGYTVERVEALPDADPASVSRR